MIKLGYIEGYNSYTEFKFNNANDRDNHFDNWVEYTIDAYYPPYYTNVIKIDISEVPQSSPINFVILVYNNKYYYYFVDHFNYVNEDIYEIVINMDTVLTHMFDFRVKQGLITRKSINRWNGNEINRNYVRENVSEGIMEVSEFNYTNPNRYIIVTSSKSYVDNSRPSGHYRLDNRTKLDFGYYVYLFPLPPFELNDLALIHMYDNNGNQNLIDVYYRDIVRYFITDPYTINMMIVESEYLDKVYGTTWRVWSDYTECSLSFTPYIDVLDIVTIDSAKYCGFNIVDLVVDNNLVNTHTFEFVKNTVDFKPFNYIYVPQLLDENYIQIEYGDVNGFASYPLHQSKSVSVNLYNNLDITNGNSGYYILDTSVSNNKYNTYNISLGLTFDLITDPWLEYQAQNKGTLSTGLQLQAVNTLYGTAKNIAMPTVNRLFNQTRSLQYFEQGKEGLSDIYANQSFRNQQQQLTGLTDGLMQGMNIIANYQINKENLEYSPDTVKGRANLYSMIFSKYKSPYLKIHKVNDIINCARKLEEYGYRVNEVFNGNEYISSVCTLRSLYNCISMKITQYDIDFFIPNDIINDMLSRIENGLRFIDVHSVPDDLALIDVFKYDNKER